MWKHERGGRPTHRCPLLPAAQHRGTRANGQGSAAHLRARPATAIRRRKKAGLPPSRKRSRMSYHVRNVFTFGEEPLWQASTLDPAGNGITRRTMIKTSAVLIGSCALGFHRRHLARMQRGQQRRRRFLRRVRPGNAARRWPALLHQRRRRGNRVLGRGAFPGPEPCRRHHSALLSQWRKPRFLLLDVGAAWVPCHRDGNAAYAQRRRRELRRRRFHPT